MGLTINEIAGIKDIKLKGYELGFKVYRAYDEFKGCQVKVKECGNGNFILDYGNGEEITIH